MRIYSIFLVAVLVSISAIAVAQPQSFPEGSEKFVSPNNRGETNSFPITDIELFGKLGDFINPDSPGVSVIHISAYPLRHQHTKDVKAVFKNRSPVDLHNAFSEIRYTRQRPRIPSREVSGPTIFVVATSYSQFYYNAVLKKNPDTVILISSGNSSKKNPRHAISRYKKISGKNIFHAGGLHWSGRGLHRRSSGPGDYEDVFIAEPYHTYIYRGNKRFSGTSGSSPTLGGKLAMLYKALNVNHTWSMRDAMQLLMAIRNPATYHADLTKLLVQNEVGKVHVDENGNTHLLPEETLREILQNSPLYKAQ